MSDYVGRRCGVGCGSDCLGVGSFCGVGWGFFVTVGVELFCDYWGGEKTMSISMCLSGRRMHVWMLTPSDKFGGEHRKVDSGAYINYFDAQRFYGWEMQIDWDFPLSRYCRRD